MGVRQQLDSLSDLSVPVFANRLGIPNIKSPDVITTFDDTTTFDAHEPTDVRSLLRRCAERRRQTRGRQRPPSISMVHRILRDHNESSYEPQLVSIGPIHAGIEKLAEFEWLKECYLGDLLNRCDYTPKETLEACLLKVITLIPKIKESYDDTIKKFSDDELADMMVMDGCFILEFCFKHDSGNWHLPNKMQTRRIAMDLILLENQVPFFVLEALFDCFMGKRSFTLSQVLDANLAPYIQLFSSDLFPEKNPTTHVDSDSTHDHVLGYLHKLYQPVVAKSSNPVEAEASKLVDEELAAESSNPVEAETLRGHTIVELDRSGMNFTPHQEDDWSMTIKFQSSLFPCLPWFGRKSTLLMPTMVIRDTTELILRNFIAYEQSFPDHVDYYFTSYAVAMDILIDTQEDIAKLVESKVLVNRLGSNQEAADTINNICNNMLVTDFCYIQEFKQMDNYCKRFWPKKISARLRGDFAWVRHTYLNNSWKAIALYSAIILFSLTVVQTIFTIKAA